MQIRPFTIADYGAVVTLWASAGLTLKLSDTLPEVRKKLERDPDLFLVAEEEGRVIGAVMGAWDGRRGWIYHLAVHPAAQRRGVGARLMRDLEERLRTRGALKLNLLVERRNEGVVRFYERLGYCVGDAIFMGKEMGAPSEAPENSGSRPG